MNESYQNHGWNEYKKGKPVNSDYYLVFAVREQDIFKEFYDADLGGWLEYNDDDISHWQPLPQAPAK